MAIQKGRGRSTTSTRAGKSTRFSGTVRKIKRYGWVPDHPDQRDFSYAVSLRAATSIPSSVDLRHQCPAVIYDQGQLGSCTANAIAGALQFDMIKEKEADFIPSRLFIYYNERAIEGTVASDSGAQIRDGIKSVASQGACPEGDIGDPPPDWPYDISKFAVEPPSECYVKAHDLTAINYFSVTQNAADMKGCLAEGFPFVFGFTVYESFESQEVAQTGEVPMPGQGEKVLGGHAVLAVGYDDKDRQFICRNSWGSNWGDAGYFYMPYAYLLDDNLSSDFWTIRSVK
jgi:C1A family cysteine protease